MIISSDITKIIQPILRKLILILLATLPVLAYVWVASVAQRNGIFSNEDWDYFMQIYEAARISILQYHQFPWWNSWNLGGIPLFANPQFGLLSIQMPLVLAFGTVIGLHLAIAAYLIIGFWGMYFLLHRIGANSIIKQLLLSYIFVCSGYVAWHLGYGHLTFGTYLLAPWFFLTLLNIRAKNGWLWFSLVAAFLINQAAHYTTIQCLLIGICIVLYQIITYYNKNKEKDLHWMVIIKPYLWGASLLVLLAGPKLFYCLHYLHEYSRLVPIEPNIPFNVTWAAITARGEVNPKTFHAPMYAWQEYANYFGLITLALFAVLIISDLRGLRDIPSRKWLLLGAIALSFLLTLGPAFPLAPYSLLHKLPVFSQMRVPSRWIGWFSFGVILYLAWLPRNSWIYFLLILSAIDVAIVNYPVINMPQPAYYPPAPHAQFQQYAGFDYRPGLPTYRLLKATQSNRGEVYGYEPMLLFISDILPEDAERTDRCGSNQGCDFVLTGNAKVIYWSPLKVLLQRTGSGPIKLNMNPGRNWYINGKEAFPNHRILELKEPFLIIDPSQQITIVFKPRL